MASGSSVLIGGYYLGGTDRYVGDSQARLFNSTDLVAVGNLGDKKFLRTYRMNIFELRRRLEAIGYSVDRVREDIATTLKKAYAELSDRELPQCRDFLDYGCAVTNEDLIELAQKWKTKKSDPVDCLFPFELDDFAAAMLQFVQGDIPIQIPNQSVWLQGHHFERLLCEVFEDDEILEIDFTSLVKAGYYKPDVPPLSDGYDKLLSQIDAQSLRLGERLTEEESEELEFKTVTGANPPKTIADQITKYVIGFLNRAGGKILFGVSDAGEVEGVKMDRSDRDELRKRINDACTTITPSFAIGSLTINYRPLISVGRQLEDQIVVEVIIPPGKSDEMYFKGSDTWVRVGTQTRVLRGHELFVHIRAIHNPATHPAISYPKSGLHGINILDPDISAICVGETYSMTVMVPQSRRFRVKLKRTLHVGISWQPGAWHIGISPRNWQSLAYDKHLNEQLFEAGPGPADINIIFNHVGSVMIEALQDDASAPLWKKSLTVMGKSNEEART